MISAQQEGGGFTTAADVFEVYSGTSRERLGGFRAPGTWAMSVTSDPGKILVAMETSIGIFDLVAGTLTTVDLGGTPIGAPVWLPDPRVMAATPPRWSFVRTLDSEQAWLIDLEKATGKNLVAVLGNSSRPPSYAFISFSPDSSLAVALVDELGASIFDPENPDAFRKVDGGVEGAISGMPSFSSSGTRIVYSVLADAGATEGRIVIEDVASQTIVAEVGGVSATTSAVFVGESESLILLMGGNEVVCLDAETGREQASAQSGPVSQGYGFTTDYQRVIYGSSEVSGQDIVWQMIELADGTVSDITDLEGLTFYNGSYTQDTTFTLFGPPYVARGDETVDSLIGFATDAQRAVPLLDDVSSTDLNYGYSTSANGSIALFVEYDAHLMDLSTGDVRTFVDFTTGSNPHGSFVSPDGSVAAISRWETEGAGTQSVYLIDVENGGEPQLFREGVVWVWAGQNRDAQSIRPTDAIAWRGALSSQLATRGAGSPR